MWIGEVNGRAGIALKIKADRVLFRGSSRYFPEIIVAESRFFGKFLVLMEGEEPTIQVADNWDFYSEMLVHVPMTVAEKISSVLIIGGGDGSTLREVLKYPEVEKVTVVDIDGEVLRVGREIMNPEAFNDRRVSVVVEDASEYVKRARESFDVIIGDYSDPYMERPAGTLVLEGFYRNLKGVLSSSGIVAMQAGGPVIQPDVLRNVYRGLKKAFKEVMLYCSPVALYPGGLWCYALASDENLSIEPRREVRGLFYNPEVHKASFALPEFVRKMIEGGG